MLLIVLKGEIETCMRLLGVEKVHELGPRFVSTIAHTYLIGYLPSRAVTNVMQQVNTRAVERDIYDGPANLDTGLWSKAKL